MSNAREKAVQRLALLLEVLGAASHGHPDWVFQEIDASISVWLELPEGERRLYLALAERVARTVGLVAVPRELADAARMAPPSAVGAILSSTAHGSVDQARLDLAAAVLEQLDSERLPVPRFVSRKDAPKLWRDRVLFTFTPEQLLDAHEPQWDRCHNYEIEERLQELLGEEVVITEWCRYRGRFCKLRDFVPYPHPPTKADEPKPPETDIPWNEWRPEMTTRIDRS